MKKTAIIISSLLDSMPDAEKVKKQLIRYFGERMIIENDENVPSVCLNTEISEEDVKTIEKIVKEEYENSVILIIITFPKDKVFGNENVITLTI